MSTKAYKYRIDASKVTAEKLQWVLDRARELYNAALAERKEAWRMAGKSIGYYEQIAVLSNGKLIDHPHYFRHA